MKRGSLLLGLLMVVATTVAACGASDPGWPPQQTSFALYPALVSAEVTPGQNRLLFNILDAETNQSIASPDRPVELRFYDFGTDRTRAAVTAQAEFMQTVEGRPGLYRAIVDLPRAGEWGVEASATEADGSKRIGRLVFDVREQGTTPGIGDLAPSVDTPTGTTDDEIAQISTDDDPDPDFYRESVADALAAHEPFALVFATPAFCSSATCGPTLDLVKSVAADFKTGMTFINVEPYQLESVDGHLQPVLSDQNTPLTVEAVDVYGLPTEPYIFVVDRGGRVTAKFEGIASAEELRAAFEGVSS